MYTNKCTKCGKEFETKNPKRVICPECLYPDRAPMPQAPTQEDNQGGNSQSYPRSYSAGSGNDNAPSRRPNYQDRNQGGYNNDRSGGGYNNNRQGGGGYNNNRSGGYNNQGGGYQNRSQGGYNNNRSGGFGQRRPMGGPSRPREKTLLIDKDQLLQIEELYKKMLPLPNPNAHEVIGEQINIEPKKVFFGINLIRQKMMLPKITFTKRKLAITPDQMMAIKNLYEPLLPLPPIGCHKILAAQLKIDEWRVHVGIGLVRKQLGLERWNQERDDAPKEFKKKPEKAPKKTAKKAADETVEKAEKPEKAPKKAPAKKTTKKAAKEE